jgi:hypothetical protein
VAAPAAAEVPVLAYLVVGLLAMVAWAVCLGLHGVWIHTFGALFHKLGGIKISAGPLGSAHPLGFLDDAANSVANALLAGATKSQHTMGYFFHGVAVIQGWVARELVGLATDTLHWMQWMQRVALPQLGHVLGKVTFPWPTIYKFIRKEIAGERSHTKRVTDVTVKVDRTTLKRIVTAAVAAAIGAALPGVHIFPRLRKIENDLTSLWKSRRRLLALLTATGSLALVARAFKKAGLDCLLGKNGRKIGKTLCRFDTDLLDILMAGGVAVVGISVVTFAKDLQAIEDDVLGAISKIVSEFPAKKDIKLTGKTFPH